MFPAHINSVKHVKAVLCCHRGRDGLALGMGFLSGMSSRHGTSAMRCNDGVGLVGTVTWGMGWVGGNAGLSEIISGRAIQELRG